MGDDDLPVPRDDDHVDRLRETAEALDNDRLREALVPFEAYDVGDVDVRENPRASDLGYVEGGDTSVARNFRGDSILYDESNGEAWLSCDDETFVENVADWN